MIGWLDSYKYDSGKAPAAALMAHGVLVETHQSQNDATLWSHVGQICTYP